MCIRDRIYVIRHLVVFCLAVDAFVPEICARENVMYVAGYGDQAVSYTHLDVYKRQI